MTFIARYLFILFLPTLITVSGIAKSSTHEAHRHGQAELTLVLENGVLEIQFESPAANILGFEHIAKSLEQRKAVRQAEMILKQPDVLFSFDGTRCQAKTTGVNMSGVIAEEQDKHEHHNHSAKHDDGHSEISARYHFSCDNPEKLDSVEVLFFKRFPGIEQINAMWVTETKQGAVSLIYTSSAIFLR